MSSHKLKSRLVPTILCALYLLGFSPVALACEIIAIQGACRGKSCGKGVYIVACGFSDILKSSIDVQPKSLDPDPSVFVEVLPVQQNFNSYRNVAVFTPHKVLAKRTTLFAQAVLLRI